MQKLPRLVVSIGLVACWFISAALAQNPNRRGPQYPSGVQPGANVGGEIMNWTVNGEQRTALVFVPTTDMAVKRPVVFAFHGHGGNMRGAAQKMHIQTVWPEAIVVYPQGLPTKSRVDPQGTKPGWQQTAGTDGDRDLKFFDEMLATLKRKYLVANDRIYATGFSNGGVFSYLLWAERGDVIAGIAEVAGRLFEPEHPTQPRPVLAIAGRADTTDPFPKQQQSIETARQIDNANAVGQPCPAPNGIVCTIYASTSQTPVKTLIHSGAHVYPPWAPQQIVAFFKNHSL